MQRGSDGAGGVEISCPLPQRIVLACLVLVRLNPEPRIPNPESRIPNPEPRVPRPGSSPPIAVEFEPALQALDTSLDLGEVVRFAASRTRGLVRVLVRPAQ